MDVMFHADDYGITTSQARRILSLCNGRKGHCRLSGVSIFVNSPAFEDSAALAMPYINEGLISPTVHLNLVEGPCCADPKTVPLLVNEKGMFCHDFLGLWRLSGTKARSELRAQIVKELTVQIERYLEVFPSQRAGLFVDSHQHTHMIPLVFDAMSEAVGRTGCELKRLRVPEESIFPYLRFRDLKKISVLNIAKNALLFCLSKSIMPKIPEGCEVFSFCGIVFSGKMNALDDRTMKAIEKRAAHAGRDLEVLFHPVSVPVDCCLDPENVPFANACASSGRNKEMAWFKGLQTEGSMRAPVKKGRLRELGFSRVG